ncbi:MAG: TIGR02281 family clan AA aspartic protease [Gammaproteobacteria bacterium]
MIAPCSNAVDKITVTGLFRDKAVVDIDGKQRVLAIGQTSPEGVKLIAADSKEAVLEVDGKQQAYALGSSISNNFTGPVAGETVTIAPDTGGMYLVNGSINGYEVSFVVDTGASLISMNKHQAKRIGLDYKMKGIETMTETASGYTKIYLVKLKEVKVGNITVNDVDGAVHDNDFPTVILLGNSFLGKVNLYREGMLLQLKE